VIAALFGIGAMVAGAALVHHGGGGLNGLSGLGFPGALRGVAGDAAGTLFALGLIEAGAVAVLTISASTGYAVSECLGAPHSMNDTVRGAAVFYGANLLAALLAAAVILIPGAPLLSISLNANVLATVLLPVSLVFLLLLANDRELMGRWANGPRLNVLTIAIVGFVSLSGAAYAVVSFLQVIHVL
jgi:Mn2+/Fe2+ NRAMP family transporter